MLILPITLILDGCFKEMKPKPGDAVIADIFMKVIRLRNCVRLVIMHKPILNCWEKTGSSDVTAGSGCPVGFQPDKMFTLKQKSLDVKRPLQNN
jgi:hypothetical protein